MGEGLNKEIFVTRPFIPPLAEYFAMLERIWEKAWLTNHGPLSLEFEEKLANYLGVDKLQYLTNGTLALQIAFKALDIKGEVITTPFSFIATSSSLHWENCKIVFADIDEHSFNIDPDIVESKISDKTSAIVATHVYGNPCNLDALERIAKKYKLKLIYDAAHCFGVQYSGKSILEYGHVSMLSLHATKLFHSTEGGILVAKDPDIHNKIWSLKNFGFRKEDEISGQGINGKNCEFHAAMGLCNLKYANEILDRYKSNYKHYLAELQGISGLTFQAIHPDSVYNYAYFPVVFINENVALKVKSVLRENKIHARRYFYPSLNKVDYLSGQKCRVAESVSSRVLCLPMSNYVTGKEIEEVTRIIKKTII